jgi:hypothetical protein
VGEVTIRVRLGTGFTLLRYNLGRAMAQRLIAGLQTRRPGFYPGLVHVGFVVDKVALGQVFPRVLRFSPVNFIPPVFH